jgi:hypothetical protein
MQSRLYGFFLLLTLVGSLLSGVFPLVGVHAENTPDVFVGVDIAYGDVEDVEQLADQVGLYTNLFVLGCTAVTQNRLKLDEACQYLFDKGLYFIVYQEYPLDYSWLSMTKADWLETAKTRWGSRFLGIYYADEVGGRQLDHVSGWMTVKKAVDYFDANSRFNTSVSESVSWFRNSYSGGNNVSLFTSDYALYWFDYQAGYDVVLAQFGWNYSRQLNVGLCRGAATAQDKEWGAMITWTYRQPPYIESGAELYSDLLLAYDSGAKYIMVFNSNEEYTGGILEQEHLDALKQFWQFSQLNSRKTNPVNERTAYVLPKDYAYGFRGPNDKIWGLWEADTLSTPISIDLSGIIQLFDSKLDIIYEDALGISSKQEYKSLVYWNNSTLISSTPSLSPANSVDPTNPLSPLETPQYRFLHLNFSVILVVVAATLVVTLSFILFLRVKQSRQ